MSVLTVVRGPGKGSSIALSSDRAVTIGAGGEATLRVGGDGVADSHLVVKSLKDGGFGAKGLAGPFLHNGKNVAAARLTDGDVVEVGDSAVRYSTAAPTWPEQIGGFRVLGVLGAGGMGRVYRAEQQSLSREVALKVLSRERTADPMFVGHFVAEAKAAARLNHPNIVQVFDVDHDGESYYYSMELMHGGSVEELLRRRGKLPIDAAVPIVLSAARALGFAEQMRVVHRDIKPENLMVDRHGHVKVADLGLALSEDDEHGRAVGTPHFMSPEQVRREKLDNRSDLYSLGCTFYRLVTGRTPFTGSSVREILTAHLKRAPDRADAVEPSVPAPVADVIDRLMQKDPEDRFESAQELIDALDTAMAPPRRAARWIVTAVVVVIATVLGAVLWPREKPSDPTTVIEYVTDPNAERALQERARLEAENALLQVRTRGLVGAELVAALESMADAHPDTDAADTARAEAQTIREEVARSERLAAERRAAIEAATASLRAAFQDAMGRGDLITADATLLVDDVADDLRDDEAVQSEIRTLRAELTGAAEAHVQALRDALTEALSTGDPDLALQRLAPLAALVSVDGGWPASLLPDADALRNYVADRSLEIDALVSARGQAVEQAAWSRLREAMSAADGPVEQLRAMRPAEAAAACESLAAELDGRAAGTAIAALAPAFERAQEYLNGLLAAADSEGCGIVLPSGDRAIVVALAFDDPEPGLDVRITGDGTVSRVSLADIRSDAGRYLPNLESLGAERAALVGAVCWTEHFLEARDYLASLQADDDVSGTGDDSYEVITVGLDEAIDRLEAAPEDWTVALTAELAATRLLARGLHALSDRRNLSAASFLDRLLRDRADTLIVRNLR